MNAADLYREGRLHDAIAAMNEEVKKNPSDVERRGFLSELLCIVGNLDRADAQLQTVTAQEAKAGAGVALLRQLIRAEGARRDFHASGRMPEFLQQPSEEAQLRMRASILLREGEEAEAAKLMLQAEELRPHPQGVAGDATYDDFRDLDDLLGGFLEVLTSTGKYYWIPMDQVRHFGPRKPERPVDLLWLPVEMTVEDGPEGVVYVPSVYATPAAETEERFLLGRETEWLGDEDQFMRGMGQRTFLLGEEAVPLLQLGEMEIAAGGA